MLEMKRKYDDVFADLKVNGSNYKYFITGSPTHMRWTRVVEADTLQDLWQELLNLSEINEEAVDKDYGYEDENECFHWKSFDKDYDEMIEEYLSDGNDFYYRKLSWIDDAKIDDWVRDTIRHKFLTSDDMEDLLSYPDIKEWDLVGMSGEYPEHKWYIITDINGEQYDVYERPNTEE